MQFIMTRSELVRRSKGELVALKRAFEQAAGGTCKPQDARLIASALQEIIRLLSPMDR